MVLKTAPKDSANICLQRLPFPSTTARRRRVRILQPVFGRLYSSSKVTSWRNHVLGDTEFLRRWSCRFLRVTGGRVVLRLANWSSATFRQLG